MKAEEIEKVYIKRAIEIGARIAGHMGLLYGEVAIDAVPIVEIISKELDKAERVARREALEEAAKLAESDEDEDQFDAALLKSGVDGYSLPRERDWIANTIRALADEGGKA